MEEIDLKELVSIIWRKKIIVVIITLLAALVGAVYSVFFVTPMYKSYTTLILAKNQTNIADETDTSAITKSEIDLNQNLISTYSDLLKSKTVVRDVINNLGIDRTEEQVKSSINVTYKNNNGIIQIEVVDVDAQVATNVANELADVFIKKVAEDIFKLENVHVIDKAENDDSPYNVHFVKDVIIATLIGLVISIAIIFIINMFNPTIMEATEIERTLKVNVLAEIPLIGDEK